MCQNMRNGNRITNEIYALIKLKLYYKYYYYLKTEEKIL